MKDVSQPTSQTRSRNSHLMDATSEDLREDELLWGDNPNEHYFAYFIGSESILKKASTDDAGKFPGNILACSPLKSNSDQCTEIESRASGSVVAEQSLALTSLTGPSGPLGTDFEMRWKNEALHLPKMAPFHFLPGQERDGLAGIQAHVPSFIYVKDVPPTTCWPRQGKTDQSSPNAYDVKKICKICSQNATLVLLFAIVLCIAITTGIAIILHNQGQRAVSAGAEQGEIGIAVYSSVPVGLFVPSVTPTPIPSTHIMTPPPAQPSKSPSQKPASDGLSRLPFPRPSRVPLSSNTEFPSLTTTKVPIARETETPSDAATSRITSFPSLLPVSVTQYLPSTLTPIPSIALTLFPSQNPRTQGLTPTPSSAPPVQRHQPNKALTPTPSLMMPPSAQRPVMSTFPLAPPIQAATTTPSPRKFTRSPSFIALPTSAQQGVIPAPTKGLPSLAPSSPPNTVTQFPSPQNDIETSAPSLAPYPSQEPVTPATSTTPSENRKTSPPSIVPPLPAQEPETPAPSINPHPSENPKTSTPSIAPLPAQDPETPAPSIPPRSPETPKTSPPTIAPETGTSAPSIPPRPPETPRTSPPTVAPRPPQEAGTSAPSFRSRPPETPRTSPPTIAPLPLQKSETPAPSQAPTPSQEPETQAPSEQPQTPAPSIKPPPPQALETAAPSEEAEKLAPSLVLLTPQEQETAAPSISPPRPQEILETPSPSRAPSM